MEAKCGVEMHGKICTLEPGHYGFHKLEPAEPSPEVAPAQTLSSPQGDSGAGGSVPQSLPDVYGGAVQPKRSEVTEPFASGHSFSVAETLKPTPAPATPRPSPEVAPMQPVHDGSEHHYAENYGLSVGIPAVAPRETQTELQIPSDLKNLWTYLSDLEAKDVRFMWHPVKGAKDLVERIARLENGGH